MPLTQTSDATPLRFSSERFREALADAGYNQSSFARALGVSLRSVQAWAGGAKQPGVGMLFHIARNLGRDVQWFMVEDEPQKAVA